MGGWGSGRTGGRPVADEALKIDWAWMMRTRRAVPGQRISGGLYWTRGGEPCSNISYVCDMTDPEYGGMDLSFTAKNRWDGTSKSYKQHVQLSYSEPNYGGKRWWMHCPINGDRVAKLYLPAGGDVFASRRAWKVGYTSQRKGPRDQCFERLFSLQRRLGCEQGWEQPIRRPKGMWRRTYERFERRYWELDAECAYQMMGVLKLLERETS